MAGMDGVGIPGRTLSISSGPAWGALKGLSILSEVTVLMALESETTICATILQPSVAESSDSDRRREPNFQPALQFDQADLPTTSRKSAGHLCFAHEAAFPSKAGVCSDAQSLNLQGHTCCEPALLGNPDPLKSWRHSPRDRLIFCPHLVLFKPGQILCWA